MVSSQVYNIHNTLTGKNPGHASLELVVENNPDIAVLVNVLKKKGLPVQLLKNKEDGMSYWSVYFSWWPSANQSKLNEFNSLYEDYWDERRNHDVVEKENLKLSVKDKSRLKRRTKGWIKENIHLAPIIKEVKESDKSIKITLPDKSEKTVDKVVSKLVFDYRRIDAYYVKKSKITREILADKKLLMKDLIGMLGVESAEHAINSLDRIGYSFAMVKQAKAMEEAKEQSKSNHNLILETIGSVKTKLIFDYFKCLHQGKPLPGKEKLASRLKAEIYQQFRNDSLNREDNELNVISNDAIKAKLEQLEPLIYRKSYLADKINRIKEAYPSHHDEDIQKLLKLLRPHWESWIEQEELLDAMNSNATNLLKLIININKIEYEVDRVQSHLTELGYLDYACIGAEPDHEIELPLNTAGSMYGLNATNILMQMAILASDDEQFSLYRKNCSFTVVSCLIAGLSQSTEPEIVSQRMKLERQLEKSRESWGQDYTPLPSFFYGYVGPEKKAMMHEYVVMSKALSPQKVMENVELIHYQYGHESHKHHWKKLNKKVVRFIKKIIEIVNELIIILKNLGSRYHENRQQRVSSG